MSALAAPAQVTFNSAKPITFSLEVADTPQSRARGLMHRRTLAKTAGMVFIFAQAEPQAFWMKNTYIPLDIIFIGETHAVVGVVTAEPMTLTQRRVAAPAKYVVEVGAGLAKAHAIEAGTTVTWKGLP